MWPFYDGYFVMDVSMRRNEHSQIKNKPHHHHRHGLAQLTVVREEWRPNKRNDHERGETEGATVGRHAKSSKRLVGSEAGAGSQPGVPGSPSRGMADNQMQPVVRHLDTQTQRERGTVGGA